MRTRCVTIEKESRKLASPLFHSQRMLVASFLPHHLPSLGRRLRNTLASCQSTFSLIDTFYWGRSFEDLSYWDNSFTKNHLPSLRQLLWNTLASCQRSWQANGAGADTEAAFGFVCFCRLPCLCGQVHRAASVVDQTNCLESQLLAWLWHKNLCCSHRNFVLCESIISGNPKMNKTLFLFLPSWGSV